MPTPYAAKAVIAGLTAMGVVWGGVGSSAYAEPGQDSLANYEQLSREAEELTDTILNAQPDLDNKMEQLRLADQKHSEDLARLNETTAALAGYQSSVDEFAAAAYIGGRTDGLSAILRASSPANLLDVLTIQRSVDTEFSGQLQSLRQTNQEAQDVEAASATSAADAKAAVDAAAAFRADLQNKRAELRTKIAKVNATYATLAPEQQAALPPPSVDAIAALGPLAPIPTVGTAGLTPSAQVLLAYIMATYPDVKSIGGVRADALPDHPSGRALDIMIGSDMALGDAINADLRQQSGRFGISYTMWREAAHFDHVHVTVN